MVLSLVYTPEYILQLLSKTTVRLRCRVCCLGLLHSMIDRGVSISEGQQWLPTSTPHKRGGRSHKLPKRHKRHSKVFKVLFWCLDKEPAAQGREDRLQTPVAARSSWIYGQFSSCALLRSVQNDPLSSPQANISTVKTRGCLGNVQDGDKINK